MNILRIGILICLLILPSTVLAASILVNQTYEVECIGVKQADNAPDTGLTDAKIRVQRTSDDNWLTSADAWNAAIQELALTEVTSMGGYYARDITINGVYQLRFWCHNTANTMVEYGWSESTCKNRLFC